MKDLNGPNDPVISKRIAWSVTASILAGMALAFIACWIVASIAKEILK